MEYMNIPRNRLFRESRFRMRNPYSHMRVFYKLSRIIFAKNPYFQNMGFSHLKFLKKPKSPLSTFMACIKVRPIRIPFNCYKIMC